MAKLFDIRKCSYFERYKQKFISKINKTEICWLWAKGKVNGYGAFYIDTQFYPAHRMSYMLFNGPIPANKVVRHICDNPACVNPKHLILGSMADNSLDAVKRNRGIGNQKLNEEAVKVIKWMLKYKPHRGLAAKLARLHKVDKKTRANIKAKHNWYWVQI